MIDRSNIKEVLIDNYLSISTIYSMATKRLNFVKIDIYFVIRCLVKLSAVR